MKSLTIIFAILILQTITLFAGNETDSLRIRKQCFYDAKTELENMLSGTIPLDYERAVFITENAYWNNEIDYSLYKSAIDFHAKNIKELAEANRNEKSQNFKATILETEEQKREKYQNLLYNWAIYTYLTDTTMLKMTLSGNDYILYHLPYEYSYNDPMAVFDWKNSQVFSLLDNNKANCYAMAVLYKILANRFNTDAAIGIAPGHAYITHTDQKGTHYNIELANKSFPGAGSIMTLTYTPLDAVRSGIAMRTLNLKQSVALCLISLAKGYEHTFNTKTDNFLYQCAQTTLKYDSLNLNAMLLKAAVLEEKLTNKNKTIQQLQADKEFKEYQDQIALLYTKGYREMPLEMKNRIINHLQNGNAIFYHSNHTPKGFQTIHPKDERYATLSWGMFDEVHEPKLIEQYGRAMFNTKTKKITKFVTADTLYNKYPIDPVVFAWQIDPLAHEFPSMSPYVALGDNPILYIDPDGQKIVAANATDQAEILNAINSTYSSDVASKFTFKDNELIYTGDRTLLKGMDKKIAEPMLQVMDASYVVEVSFQQNEETKKNGGGLAERTIGQDGNIKGGSITVDPNINTTYNKESKTVYESKQGYTLDENNAIRKKGTYGEDLGPKVAGSTIVDVPVQTNKIAAFFHEIGHFAFWGQKKEKVIQYENDVRKTQKIEKRDVDESHTGRE